METRVTNGLAGISIQWPVIAGIGLVKHLDASVAAIGINEDASVKKRKFIWKGWHQLFLKFLCITGIYKIDRSRDIDVGVTQISTQFVGPSIDSLNGNASLIDLGIDSLHRLSWQTLSRANLALSSFHSLFSATQPPKTLSIK
jgi:hypothetical protein